MIPQNNDEIRHPKQWCLFPTLYILDDQFAELNWKYATHHET